MCLEDILDPREGYVVRKGVLYKSDSRDGRYLPTEGCFQNRLRVGVEDLSDPRDGDVFGVVAVLSRRLWKGGGGLLSRCGGQAYAWKSQIVRGVGTVTRNP